MKKLFIPIILITSIYGCTRSNAASVITEPKKVVYEVKANDVLYETKSIARDSLTNCIKFQSVCGCGGKISDVEVCGSYTIVKKYE